MSWTLIYAGAAGAVLGRVAAGWAATTLHDIPSTGLSTCPSCSTAYCRRQRWLSLRHIRCRTCTHSTTVLWPLGAMVALALLFAGFAWMLTVPGCQNVAEVQPSTPMHQLRLPFHLTLIFLLAVATLTDLLDYIIADDVVWVGILVAVLAAFVSGDLQMIHVWVNWDADVTGFHGPYLPEWMKHHQHLHGLLWPLAGMVTGATFVWLVRTISTLILGQPAMGLGDVTIMGMIGAFIGWQPALCTIALAPLTAVVIGTLVRVATGRSFVAFGPYLALSAVIVICSWRWLWAEPMLLRDVFSHWPSIAGLAGGALATLAILLFGLRIFQALPPDTIRR